MLGSFVILLEDCLKSLFWRDGLLRSVLLMKVGDDDLFGDGVFNLFVLS